MDKVTCKSIIVDYIFQTLDKDKETIVSTSDIALLSGYGLKRFDVMYSPDTYSRKFREWKAEQKTLLTNPLRGLISEEIYEVTKLISSSRQNYYLIKKVN